MVLPDDVGAVTTTLPPVSRPVVLMASCWRRLSVPMPARQSSMIGSGIRYAERLLRTAVTGGGLVGGNIASYRAPRTKVGQTTSPSHWPRTVGSCLAAKVPDTPAL